MVDVPRRHEMGRQAGGDEGEPATDERSWTGPFEAGLAALKRGCHEEAEHQLSAARAEADRLSLGHWHHAVTLENLAAVYCGSGRYADAEPLYEQALGHWMWVTVDSSPFADPRVATALVNLAAVWAMQGRSTEAVELVALASGILEESGVAGDDRARYLGPSHIWGHYDSHGRYLFPDRWLWPPCFDREPLRSNTAPPGLTICPDLGGLTTAPEHTESRNEEALLVWLAALQERVLPLDHASALSTLERGMKFWWGRDRDAAAVLSTRWLKCVEKNAESRPIESAKHFMLVGSLHPVSAEAERMFRRALALGKRARDRTIVLWALQRLERVLFVRGKKTERLLVRLKRLLFLALSWLPRRPGSGDF